MKVVRIGADVPLKFRKDFHRAIKKINSKDNSGPELTGKQVFIKAMSDTIKKSKGSK